ncbi:proton-conducting transporter membrane subunit [Gemmatimonas sp.]|uniref:proton-conducting transporter transmembrane domain-containing protein n=1 Tax=Gemmatimonas sp. TaxID=1962908 RepID=UPI00286DF4CC|nr:proton-conducting transporter membrane subunit [Gemmatimonas sp.]
MTPFSAPWEALVFCLVLLAAPLLAQQGRRPLWPLVALIATQSIAFFAGHGAVAYAAVAGGALIHAAGAWHLTRTGALMLLTTGGLTAAAAVSVHLGHLTIALVLSCLAIAMRTGAMPLHVGVAQLCDRAPVVQTQQLASTIALVFVHLRFVDHHAAAMTLAPWLIRGGAIAAIVAALITLVQKDLRGFYRGTTTMHGGMVLAAIGTASYGGFAAALLVTVTMGLALGGIGIMTSALESRVGPVSFSGPGGRVVAFPVLAAAFALFGGAGVGLPGMAGFVADDLLLHTLWMESPFSTVAMILASAFLAVATLTGYAKTFLGRGTPSIAPDLLTRERVVAATLLVLLLVLGFMPGLLLTPADAFLSVTPA